MTASGISLVLRYNPGQFTFRHLEPGATNQQLYDLAQSLNAFQECNVRRILRSRVMTF